MHEHLTLISAFTFQRGNIFFFLRKVKTSEIAFFKTFDVKWKFSNKSE